MTAKHSGSDARTPYRVRASTSRPSASVPSRCSALGGSSGRPVVASGSYGDHRVIVSAITSQPPNTIRPRITGTVSHAARPARRRSGRATSSRSVRSRAVMTA